MKTEYLKNLLDFARQKGRPALMARARDELAALETRIAQLESLFALVPEIHPTRNSHETYVGAVLEIATRALGKEK